MALTRDKITFWRGTRAQYDALGDAANPNTYYTVREEDGRWSYFYGPQIVISRSGQLMPAKEMVDIENFTDEMKDAMVPGKTRYVIYDPDSSLTGVTYPDDYTGYYEVEKRVDGRLQITFIEKGVSVRIGGRKLYKTFQVTDTEFRTYDDGNCGEY